MRWPHNEEEISTCILQSNTQTQDIDNILALRGDKPSEGDEARVISTMRQN